MFRILLLNGNSTQRITDKLVVLAKRAYPDLEFVGVTPEGAPEYVSTPEDVEVSGQAVYHAVEKMKGHAFDSCLIACYGEPGLMAARRAAPFPVFGMAHASALQALHHGSRFAVLTLGTEWPRMLPPLFRSYGLAAACVRVQAIDGEPLQLSLRPDLAAEVVAEAAAKLTQDFQLDAIVLGGAALTGLPIAQEARAGLPPIIDCLEAAVAQIIATVRYGHARSADRPKLDLASTPSIPSR